MKKCQEDKTKKLTFERTDMETRRHISFGQTNVQKEGNINAKRKT